MADFTPFNLSKLKTLMHLDQHLVDLSKGNVAFECPDIASKLNNGEKYKANEVEVAFTKKATNYALFNFFKYTAVGGIACYLMSSSRPKTRVINTSLGAIVGSTFGVSKATIGIMQKQIALNDSPIAIESRYQLWKLDPSHEWLSEYDDDVRRWNELKHYGTMNMNTSMPMHSSMDREQMKRHVTKHLKAYKQKKEDEMNDFEQKRQRFYENRKRLGQNEEYSMDHIDESLYDYERQNNIKHKRKRNRTLNNNDDEFIPFESSSSSSKDIFVEHETEKMSWG